MAGFSGRKFNPDFETAEELEKVLSGPALKNDEELDNFLGQVDQVAEIIRGLASGDKNEQEKALRKADILIREEGDGPNVDPESVKCEVKQSRTVINKMSAEGDQGDMSKEAFMRSVEKDANERAEKRKIRKEQSDLFRKKGNKMFRAKDYAGALFNFNEAIKLVKDSPCLYNNRALTYIRIGIYSSALEDCDRALELETHSIRARMLKAKSLFHMSEPEKCRICLQEAREIMPHHMKTIDECEKNIFTMGQNADGANPFDLPNETIWKNAEKNEWDEKK